MMRLGLKLAAVALGCITLGAVISLVLLITLLHAPASHTAQALQYLVTSAVVSLAAGSIVLFGLSRSLPSLALKIGVAWTMASVAAILIVVYTPWMMFASRKDLYLLLITLIYFTTISLGFAVMAATAMTRQIHALREGAARVASGEFGVKVEVQGVDEVADLAQSFNRMSAELGKQFDRERLLEQSRRDLIASVSHDLRTPLASIRAMIEAINDGVVTDPPAVRRYLGLIEHESHHLGQLIDDLFELSRMESGTFQLRCAPVPLGELVAETAEGMRIQAEERGIELRISTVGDMPNMMLDGPRMQRVLINLIQNSVRHTPPGGCISVNVARTNGEVEMSVADTGEGIAHEDQEHIFDQFYRGEKSRSRGTGGAGLGLAIARGIVEAHGGTIGVENVPGTGARFLVKLDTAALGPADQGMMPSVR